MPIRNPTKIALFSWKTKNYSWIKIHFPPIKFSCILMIWSLERLMFFMLHLHLELNSQFSWKNIFFLMICDHTFSPFVNPFHGERTLWRFKSMFGSPKAPVLLTKMTCFNKQNWRYLFIIINDLHPWRLTAYLSSLK